MKKSANKQVAGSIRRLAAFYSWSCGIISCIVLSVAASCTTAKFPLLPTTKAEKKAVYSVVKDTLTKEWTQETKNAGWKVVSIEKYVAGNFIVRTRARGQAYPDFFITVSLDSSLRITRVGKELRVL